MSDDRRGHAATLIQKEKSSMETLPQISRRKFLFNTASAAAVATAALLPGTAFAAEERPIIGSGDHTYEVVHDWLTTPYSLRFGDTQGIAQDAYGNIYVGHTVHPDSLRNDAIAVFDPNGTFLASWGERFKGGSHGLSIRVEGDQEFIYHCDTAHRQVVKTDLLGRVLWEMGVPKEPGCYNDKAPYVPTNVAFAPNGDFYIADGYGSYWIHQYDIDANWIRTFGGPGSAPGKVSNPHGLWVDGRGSEPLLAVADRGNSRIQYFSLDGKHVKFVSQGMRQPCNFSIRGSEMLVPDLRSVVTLLDKDNRVITQLGDGDPSRLRNAARNQFVPGKFIHPHDAIFLDNGDILVAEWVPIGRITLLKRRLPTGIFRDVLREVA
jgi:hypothetical protein